MVEKLKEHWFTILVVIFVLYNILKPAPPTEFKRWAYIAEDENAAQWERVIAHIDRSSAAMGDNDDVTVYCVYAIEWPDSDIIRDADAQYIEKLRTDRAEWLNIYDSDGEKYKNRRYYIRVTDEKVE